MECFRQEDHHQARPNKKTGKTWDWTLTFSDTRAIIEGGNKATEYYK